jgi:hypothetical protein
VKCIEFSTSEIRGGSLGGTGPDRDGGKGSAAELRLFGKGGAGTFTICPIGQFIGSHHLILMVFLVEEI